MKDSITNPLSIKFSDRQLEELRWLAQQKGKTVSQVVRLAVAEAVARQKTAGAEDLLKTIIHEAIDKRISRTEERLAKITAKTANIAAISLFTSIPLLNYLSVKYELKKNVLDLKILRLNG